MAAVTITLGSLTIYDTYAATADADGNVWSWQTFEGWFGNPQPAFTLLDRGGHRGVRAAGKRYQGRAMTLTGYVDCKGSQTQLYKALNKLDDIFDLVDSSATLTVNEPVPKQAAVILNGTPDLKTEHYRGVHFQIPMLAEDPAKYSTTEQNGTTSVVVAGTFNTRPRIKFTGAVTNPSVTVTDPSSNVYTVALTYSLASGHFLNIYCDTGQILLDDTTDLMQYLDTTTSTVAWPEFAPGTNTVSAGTAYWRDAYI